MWDIDKAILVTNNDRVYEKYKNEIKIILLNTLDVIWKYYKCFW